MKTARPASRSRLYPTPDDAENAFYDAFERGDLAAMMAVWAEADDVVCVHPQGPRLVGFEAVRESWGQIFAGGSQVRIQVSETHRFDGPTVAVHSLVESLAPAGGGASGSVHATNVYELTEGGWRMVVHHASLLGEAAAPDEPPAPAHTLH
ncbi:MAG TPA: nuclear transport factor 2 family protein [Usitatibacter sp.]|nr:nuclear transport factor 2 family protein [Usitatibacter sp.]